MISKDLMQNVHLLNEPELEVVRKAAFDAVVGLIGKGYSRAEVMEAIMSDAHTASLTSILKLRWALNLGENPWNKSNAD